MSASDLALLRAHLKPIAMPVFTDMEQPNRAIDTVYFMEAGIASVVAVQPDETKVEVGLIGREGMTDCVVLGGDQSPHSTYIQVAGEGQRIAYQGIAQGDGCERYYCADLLLKFAQVFMVQTAHTAIANARSRSTNVWRDGF